MQEYFGGNMAGKGDKPRPLSISHEQYRKNMDRWLKNENKVYSTKEDKRAYSLKEK